MSIVSSNLLDNFELKDEKTLLIQGLPSSIEKQFAKLSYAKNITPLLKSKKVDFVLIFAVNQQQLKNILKDIFQVIHDDSKLWVAFPKQTSKISSDLMRENSWNFMADLEYESSTLIPIDHVWNAMKFLKMKDGVSNKPVVVVEGEIDIIIEEGEEEPVAKKKTKSKKSILKTETTFPKSIIQFPIELEKCLNKNKKERDMFTAFAETNQLEFVNWIKDAKKMETRLRRIEQLLEKLNAGKSRP